MDRRVLWLFIVIALALAMSSALLDPISMLPTKSQDRYSADHLGGHRCADFSFVFISRRYKQETNTSMFNSTAMYL